MCTDDTFPGNDDEFPHSDKIFQAIKAEINECEKVSVGSTSTYSLRSYLYAKDSLETLVALQVYPVDPIYDSKELNRFAEENLVPLFSPLGFEYQESKIQEKHLLRYIPWPSKSLMTLPCFKRKEVSPAKQIKESDYPGQEISYHIILFPDKAGATNFCLRSDEIKEEYCISLKDIKDLINGTFELSYIK